MIQTVAFATLCSPSHLHTHDQLNTQPQSKRKKRSATPPSPKAIELAKRLKVLKDTLRNMHNMGSKHGNSDTLRIKALQKER